MHSSERRSRASRAAASVKLACRSAGERIWRARAGEGINGQSLRPVWMGLGAFRPLQRPPSSTLNFAGARPRYRPTQVWFLDWRNAHSFFSEVSIRARCCKENKTKQNRARAAPRWPPTPNFRFFFGSTFFFRSDHTAGGPSGPKDHPHVCFCGRPVYLQRGHIAKNTLLRGAIEVMTRECVRVGSAA